MLVAFLRCTDVGCFVKMHKSNEKPKKGSLIIFKGLGKLTMIIFIYFLYKTYMKHNSNFFSLSITMKEKDLNQKLQGVPKKGI
jgi:hypothetical protein